jgi:metal-responsive CopG/Arc/MetJ family transcriptional regulator
MKITIEITEELLARTLEVARREGITLRGLIEEALRTALAQRDREQEVPYHWPDLSVDGEGLASYWARGRELGSAPRPDLYGPGWLMAADFMEVPVGRMTVTIDDALLEEAKEALGARTRAEAIRAALAEVVRRRRLAHALQQRGQFQLRGDVE